jgi:hypothetical protein
MIDNLLPAVLALALTGAAICLALRLVLTHDLFRPETRSERRRPIGTALPRF